MSKALADGPCMEHRGWHTCWTAKGHTTVHQCHCGADWWPEARAELLARVVKEDEPSCPYCGILDPGLTCRNCGKVTRSIELPRSRTFQPGDRVRIIGSYSGVGGANGELGTVTVIGSNGVVNVAWGGDPPQHVGGFSPEALELVSP